MSKVKDKKLINDYGDEVLNKGFTAIPNLLLENQKKLNLTDIELLFYIKTYMFHSKDYIKYNELKLFCSNSTIRRAKKELQKKGYLETKELYIKKENGKLIGIGTKYDWTGLIKIMKNLPPTVQFEKAETNLKKQRPICKSRDQFEKAETNLHDTTTTKERIDKERIDKECIDKERIVKECDIKEKIFISIPLKTNKDYLVTESIVVKYENKFPNINVRRGFEKMLDWCIEHPQRLKTQRGMSRFFNNWFTNNYDKNKKQKYDRNKVMEALNAEK